MTFTQAAHDTSGDTTRDAAILQNMGLIKNLARRFRQHVPPCITIDDLTSAGIIGLIQAVDRFHHSRGLKFRSYAQHRIWGAMMDFLRGEDPLSRDERRRVRHSAEPRWAATISLSQLPPTVADNLLRTDWKAARSMWADVSSIAQTLSTRERRVIVLIYEQGWCNREIATTLKVNESRVSQIKHRALSKMRAAIQAGNSARAA